MERYRKKNLAKERLRAGQSLVAFGLTTPSIAVAQVLAGAGADMLIVDMEHACVDLGAVQALVSADLGQCTCIVRLPGRTPALIKPVLDAGSMGLTFPMICDAAELRETLSHARYFPEGKRAIGPHTAPARWGLSTNDYIHQANDALLFNTLIETADAVNDIEAIVQTEGLDIVTIGLGDLSASLGKPGEPDHPAVREAVNHIESVVLGSNIALGGIVRSPSDIPARKLRGYRVLVLGFDVTVLGNAATELVKICTQ